MAKQTTEDAPAGDDPRAELLTMPPSPDLGPVIEQVRNLVERHYAPRPFVAADPISGALAPGYMDEDGPHAIPATLFDDYLEAPRRRTGTAALTKIDSLIAHVNRFKDADSALFAIDDRTKPSIEAVLDYHPAGATSDPRFGKHRSRFDFPLSDEWQAWAKFDKEVFQMREFAEFLEDRIPDVLDMIPDEDSLPEDLARFVNLCGGSIASPNKLVELSRGLHVNENAAVTEAVNLGSGEGVISFRSEHTDAGGNRLNVPGLFLIGIPVFRHGPFYRLAARLRYRKTPGGIVFFYELWRADRAFDHAFGDACERVRVETELPLLFGKPE